MNQDEKTILLIEFWEGRQEYYESKKNTKSAERCNKHIRSLLGN